MVRDWISCVPTRMKGLKGAKPEPFNRWVMDLLCWMEGDVLDDLFPGTAGMTRRVAETVNELPLTAEPLPLFGLLDDEAV